MSKADAVKGWLRQALTEDSGAPSTTRISAWVLGAAGIVFAFVHPSEPETLMALLGASTGMTLGRSRRAPNTGGEGE